MKHFLIIISLLVFFTACKDKALELPQVAASGLSDIQNYTQVWVFYKETEQGVKAEYNRKNTISTTHWIINVDKKLPLSEVIPILKRIQTKRDKKSLHSAEGMVNYLSYSDTKDERIALFSIDSIVYNHLLREALAELEAESMSDYTIAFLEDDIWLDKKRISKNDWESTGLDSLIQGKIQLHFDENLSYQDYMYYRLSINDKIPEEVTIENMEFVIK